MEKKLFNIKWTSENPYQREIDLYFWSLKIFEAFEQNKLSKKDVEKLNKIGFNWGHFESKLKQGNKK